MPWEATEEGGGDSAMFKRFWQDESGIDHPVALGISIAAVALLIAGLYVVAKGGYGNIQSGITGASGAAGSALGNIQ